MKKPHPHNDPDRVTAVGMARYACDFLRAALAADDVLGRERGHEVIAPVPVMFLVGQSIELTLKAFLLRQGMSPRDVRYLGHDLDVLIDRANDSGLPGLVALPPEGLEAIHILNGLYATKELQYILTGAKTFPVFGPLQDAALRLVHHVGNQVGYPPRNLPQPAA